MKFICPFFGLNRRIDQLVHSTPNVHLDLTHTRTKFYRHFQQIFSEVNIVSVALFGFDVESLKRLSGTTSGKRLKSISLIDVPVHIFENRLLNILANFKDQLISFED